LGEGKFRKIKLVAKSKRGKDNLSRMVGRCISRGVKKGKAGVILLEGKGEEKLADVQAGGVKKPNWKNWRSVGHANEKDGRCFLKFSKKKKKREFHKVRRKGFGSPCPAQRSVLKTVWGKCGAQ